MSEQKRTPSMQRVMDASTGLRRMNRGSEDFGWYTKKIDGAIFRIGAGEKHAKLHTGFFDFPDDLIEKISSVFCELARTYKCI